MPVDDSAYRNLFNPPTSNRPQKSLLELAADPANKGPEGLMELAFQNNDLDGLVCKHWCAKCLSSNSPR